MHKKKKRSMSNPGENISRSVNRAINKGAAMHTNTVRVLSKSVRQVTNY